MPSSNTLQVKRPQGAGDGWVSDRSERSEKFQDWREAVRYKRKSETKPPAVVTKKAGASRIPVIAPQKEELRVPLEWEWVSILVNEHTEAQEKRLPFHRRRYRCIFLNEKKMNFD